MFCYYCGQKVNEKKQKRFISNKVLFDMEIRKLQYEIRTNKELIKETKYDYSSKIKAAENDSDKASLTKERDDAINKLQNKIADLNNKINEKKKESALAKSPYYSDLTNVGEIKSVYICPRCGHIVHEGHDEKEIKSLSAACHAELQRGRNDFARGMSCLSIAVILGITSFIFMLLSRKADIQYQISTRCPEFWVFLVLAIISVILLVLGALFVVRGVNRKNCYTKLLKDINTKTFIQ